MKKKFLTNLALLVFLNLLVKPFWFFGIEVAVQNRVGAEMYGFYFSLFSFSFILNILLDAGINNFNNRSVARNHQLAETHLSRIIPLKFILSLIYAAIVFILGRIIGYSGEQFRLLWLLVLNQFLSSFILYFRTNISGLQYFTTDSLISVLDKSLMILFTGLLLWGQIVHQPFRIEWFVYTQTLSYVITLIVTLSILISKTGRIRIVFSARDSLDILRKSYPFALLILLMSLFNRIDSVMLERMLENGKEQAGIYAQSFRILDAASQFSLLFATLLLPMFSRMLKIKQEVNSLISISVSLLMVAAITLAVTGNFYREEIMALLYHQSGSYTARIFGLLMIGYIFIALSYIYGTLLTANGNLRTLNTLAGITVVLNFSLNLLLIPRYEAVGAAWAGLFSQAFYAISQIFLATKVVSLRTRADLILKIMAFPLLLILFTWLISTTGLIWYQAFFASLLAALILAFSLRLIRLKEIILILHEDS
ncbi:MAG: oligosaccharide flippase family protein [Bacteroidota bacterium]